MTNLQASGSCSGARPRPGRRCSTPPSGSTASATTTSGRGTTSTRSSATRTSRSSRAGRRSTPGRWRPSTSASACSSAPTRSAIPGLVAKTAATLDHISGGRAILGIGGAWMELEHQAHGIDFGSGFGQRLDWLDESVGSDARRPRRRVGDLGAGRPLRLRRPAPQAAAGPEAPADPDRRQRREEDAPDGRALRRHVERDGHPST